MRSTADGEGLVSFGQGGEGRGVDQQLVWLRCKAARCDAVKVWMHVQRR